MSTKDLISNPCMDACGTLKTDRFVEGAPVYRCPGCDSEWIELDERTPTPAASPKTPSGAEAAPADVPAAGPASGSEGVPNAIGSIGPTQPRPQLLQAVFHARDIRTLAEFYRSLLGLLYRPGDARPFTGADDAERLVLTHPDGRPALAFDAEDRAPSAPTDTGTPATRLELSVPSVAALVSARDRALAAGARLLDDQSGARIDPYCLLADPAGHHVAILVV